MQDSDFPFEYIDTKQELLQMYGASYNEMQLFACGDTPSIEELMKFCRSKRETIINGFWHIITFFDHRNNAAFTNSPMPGMFDNDEDRSRHIKAVYTFNTKNKYSKLMVYDSNKWTGMPTEIDIN